MTPKQLTLQRLVNRRALVWIKGNNSGNDSAMQKAYKDIEKIDAQIIQILLPAGYSIDFPGLYPTFEKDGRTFYNPEELHI